MADAKFARARSWEEMITIHRRWMHDYNVQRHWAYESRVPSLTSCRYALDAAAWRGVEHKEAVSTGLADGKMCRGLRGISVASAAAQAAW